MISQKVYEVIEEIANEPSRKRKESLLKEHAECLKPILKAAYDPYLTYGVSVPWRVDSFGKQGFYPVPLLDDLLAKLASRELSGNNALHAVRAMMQMANVDCAELLLRVLNKDLRMGVSAKTINAAIPGTISTFGCMLAKPFESKRAKFPMMVQPKFDGVRVIADVNVKTRQVLFFSRTGLQFTTFDHLKEPLLDLVQSAHLPYARFDGEVISGSFNKTVSEVRRKSEQATDAKYYIFDWIDEDHASKPYIARYNALMDLNETYMGGFVTHSLIFVLGAMTVNSQDEVDRFYQMYLDAGYEGAMVKDINAKYESKRSYAWMKLKEESSIDTIITGWEPGTGKYAGLIGAVTINHNGVDVNVGSGLSDGFRQEDPQSLLGRLIEVSYQHETPDGSLRHPRFKRFRDPIQPGVKA